MRGGELFAQAPIAMLVIEEDRGGEVRVAAANAAWCRASERPALTGTPADACLAPEVVAEARRVLAGGGDGEVLDAAITEGAARGYRVRIRALQGERAAILAFEDMTAQLAAEAELEQQLLLITSAAHELRAPAMTLLLWQQLLRADDLPAAERPRALDAIERSAHEVSRLIGELADLARARAGMLELDPQPVEIAPLIRAAHARAEVRARSRGREVRVRLAPDLASDAASPPPPTDTSIHADPRRLAQMLDTLFALGLRAARSEVTVALQRDDRAVELAISHDGSSSDREHDASAVLALELVRTLAALHGGEVATRSDGRDAGATFIVRLPRAVARGD